MYNPPKPIEIHEPCAWKVTPFLGMEYHLSYPGNPGFTQTHIGGKSSIGRMGISGTGIIINGKHYSGTTLSLSKEGVFTIDDKVITDVPTRPVLPAEIIPIAPTRPRSTNLYHGCTIGLMGEHVVLERGSLMIVGMPSGTGPLRRDIHRASRDTPVPTVDAAPRKIQVESVSDDNDE